MFDDRKPDDLSPNVLSVCLQPNEGTHLRFQSKVPDQGMAMRPVDMEFRYETAFRDQSIPEAYELLLEDALQGDASLFIRSDHIEEAWRIVEPLLNWHEIRPPYQYDRGSWGPQAADWLLAQDGRSWVLVCGGN